jgi:hypothetical protein
MATLNDIIKTVPALLDDASKSVFTSDFILPYVNTAQRRISSFLQSKSLKHAKFRKTNILIPAGTMILGAERPEVSTAPPNWVKNSAAANPGAWTFSVSPTTTTTGVADPEGGTTATTWAYATVAARTATLPAAVNMAASLGNQYATTSIWLKTVNPYTATVAITFGSVVGTTTINVTTEYQRATVTAGPGTSGVADTPTLTVTMNDNLTIAMPSIVGVMEFLGYYKTTGKALTALPTPVLPANFVEPDEIWEAKIGGTSQDYFRCVGPHPIPNQAQTNTLGYWDFYDGAVQFLGATDDRLLRMDYWGSLETFQDPAIPSQAVIIQNCVNPISFLVCKYISHSRGQHAAAAEWGKMADDELEDFANIQQKAQQQSPVRRLPARGAGRYQGYFRGVG